MSAGVIERTGRSSGRLTSMVSPRASVRDARASAPFTETPRAATRRAAWVRDSASWSARNRSRRSVGPALTQNWMIMGTAGRAQEP